MIKRFLDRVMSRKPGNTSTDGALQHNLGLPCIGRKSDLIPVSHEIGKIVTSRSSILIAYEKIAIQVRQTLQYDRIAISILDFEQDTYRKVFVMGRPLDGIEQGDVFTFQKSFAFEVAHSRRAIRLSPSAQYPDQETFLRSGLLSRIATPLITNDKVIGILHLASFKSDAYVEQDLINLEHVGNEIAGAIYNSILVQAERDRTSQLEALYSVAAILAQPQTFEAKAQAIVETLVRIGDADHATVRRVDEGRDNLDLVATAGSGVIRVGPTIPVSKQASAVAGAFRDGRVLIVNDYQNLPNADPDFQAQGAASMLVMPIKSGGRTLGTLSVTSKTANHFNHERVALLTAFADEFGIVFDTAELNDSLQASAARAQAVLETAADGIITIGETGIIESFNPAAEGIFGYSTDEIIGENISLLMPAPEKGAHDAHISSYLATGQTQVIGKGREVTGRRKDDTTFPMDLSIGVVEIGHTKVFTGIIRDITERKRTEAQLNESRRLASIGEMAAGVAHEINNPLAAIILASDFLSKSGLSDAASADVKIISDSAQRAARIVQNMLLFARKTDPKPERMTIDLVVQQALELKSHDFRLNNIESRMEVEKELPKCLIDRHQIGQVIINVLNNAEHALVTHQGGGHISIDIRSTSDSVILDVRDDGTGIDPELMPSIFEPFFTTKSPGEGIGLGLSICYGIIQQHGGKIWAANNHGDGTSILIKLPIARDEFETQPEAPYLEEFPDVSKTRLLVVDDEPAILDLITRGLRGDIEIIHQADGGEAALKMIKDSDYDCILLDLRMPGVNGMEVFDSIVASDFSLADRIVFMTGDTASQETATFLAGKKNLVISKPFQLEHVKRIIGSVVPASRHI